MIKNLPKDELLKHRRTIRKKWYSKNHDQENKRLVALNRLKRYGVTQKQYDKMFNNQNGVCKICNLSSNKEQLSVDHDHESGFVRGLLCRRCNRILGMVKDEPLLLESMVMYLNNSFKVSFA